MKTNLWKFLNVMVVLTMLAVGLVACAPKATPVPTKAPTKKPPAAPTVPPTVAPTEEPTPAEPVTLRVGATTIWDAINPATGWESYNLRYWFHDGLMEWAELQTFEPGLAESCDDVLVMYGGKTAEYAGVDVIYNDPLHPYTQRLMQAFPDIDNPTSSLASIPGYPPPLDALPAGCRFEPRCHCKSGICAVESPPLVAVKPGHYVACHEVKG